MPSGGSKITFKLKGASGLVRAAAMTSLKARAAVKGVITTFVIKIERRLKQELASGGSGRKYQVGGTTRQASAPGESPATQTGRYASNIRHVLKRMAGKVVADVEYAAPLEFGTDTIEPRPMWRPILAEEAPQFRAAIVQALRRVL